MSVKRNILCILPCCQFKVRNIAKEPGRVNLPSIFKLSVFVCKLLVFMRDTLTNKKSSRKFKIAEFLRFTALVLAFIHDFFLLATFEFDYDSI